MLNDLNLSGRLKTAITKNASDANLIQGAEGVMAVNQFINAVPTNEDESNEQIIRRPIKTMKVRDLVGKKKMNKPIGKLTSMRPIMGEEGETTEATSAGSAGGYEAPLFSKPKRMDSMFKDEQPKKKVKGGFVYENEETGPNGSGKFEYEHGGHKQDAFKKQVNGKTTVDEKWSEKYKRSIDCNNPKGFSQKAHCQGRQKVEANEATGSASSGSYVTPAAWAKSTSKKDWRGASKTQIPGGKFVQVKKKCKTFPYCNQGDIKALNIFENKTLQKIITKVSKEHNISESVIKTILAYEYEKNKNSK